MIDRPVRRPVDGLMPTATTRSGFPRRRNHRLTSVPLIALLLLFAGGCASTDETAGSGQSAAGAAKGGDEVSLDEAARIVRERYLVDPATARELGYRIDWQFPSPGRKLEHVVTDGDSVFTLDERNFLSRIRTEEGVRIWRVPVAGDLDEVLGITPVPSVDRVYVTTGSAVLELDIETGSQLDKQELAKIANTAPVVYGGYFIYGSRTGELVWHSYRLGSYRRGYRIAPSIEVAPVVEGAFVVTVGNNGRVMTLLADSASQVWNARALEPVVARPAVGNGAVFFAGLDQYIRAYELAEARTPLWEYLTESELTESPVLIGDRLYQQIPSEGLVCFEAMPINEPGGVVIWRAKDARGSVVTSRNDRLITWNAQARRLEIVDDRLGSTIKTYEMPQIGAIQSTALERGDLYLVGIDGRLIRLVPRT